MFKTSQRKIWDVFDDLTDCRLGRCLMLPRYLSDDSGCTVIDPSVFRASLHLVVDGLLSVVDVDEVADLLAPFRLPL